MVQINLMRNYNLPCTFAKRTDNPKDVRLFLMGRDYSPNLCKFAKINEHPMAYAIIIPLGVCVPKGAQGDVSRFISPTISIAF